MIVPMKKYSFLVYHREYLSFLSDLQELGVLHVIEKKSGDIEDEGLREKFSKIQQLNSAINFLQKREIEPSQDVVQTDGTKILEEIRGLQADKDQYLQQLIGVKKELSLIEPWGEFTWETIDNLKKAGINTRFFTCPSKKFTNDWRNNYYAEVIKEIKGQTYFILFEKSDEKTEIDAEEINLPHRRLSQISEQIKEIEAILEKTEKLFDKFAASSLDTLTKTKNKLSGELSFEKVILSTHKEAEDKLMILEGWVPTDCESDLTSYLGKKDIYFVSEDPTTQDKVPVKLKNNWFARLFEPIGQLYSLPNYNELDLTILFAPFYALFFGFCLGDAGYGIFLLAIATVIKLKSKNLNLKPLLTLGQWLGFATIVMGLLSGTFFGINLLDTGYLLNNESLNFLSLQGVPSETLNKLATLVGQHFDKRDDFLNAIKNLITSEGLEKYKSLFIRSSFADFSFLNYFRHLMLDSNQLFYLSMIIGLVQIIFGLCVKAYSLVSFKGFKYAISTLGWIILIVSMIILFGLSDYISITPQTKNILLYTSLVLSGFMIFIFNDPDSNPLISSLKGLWDAYGMISGVFGDTLSYIRLFALGTSGAILGFVMNTIAMQILTIDIPVLNYLLFVVFLLFGHSLTIALSVLGAFVHPMRLTFVEFYKNAGFTGGGKAYNPFKK